MQIRSAVRRVWERQHMPEQQSRPLITVKEARKLLGKVANNLTNEEIKLLVTQLEQIARLGVRDYMVRNNVKIEKA